MDECDDQPADAVSRRDNQPVRFKDVVLELKRLIGLDIIVQLEHRPNGPVIDFDGRLRSIECFTDQSSVVYCDIGERFKLVIDEDQILGGRLAPRDIRLDQPGDLTLFVYPLDMPTGGSGVEDVPGRACRLPVPTARRRPSARRVRSGRRRRRD